MERPKLIIFDLNKTLIKENSWLNLNLAMGLKQAEDDILMSWGSEGEGIISDAEGQAIICSIYKKRGDISRDNIMKILSDYQYLNGAKETVRNLRERGYKMALISGSMDILVARIATELAIETWRSSNHFIFDSNNKLERIATEGDENITKLNQAKIICHDLGIDVTECLSIGDGFNDVPLFKATGNGVTFKDSLYAGAAKYTISSLPEILKIVQ